MRRKTLTAAVFWALLAPLIALGALTTDAFAQRSAPYGGFDRGPAPFTRPKVISEPGKFDYYLLSLSWSPSYCAGLQRGGYDPQCNRRSGKPYSFVLHGLWPQFERGWPQDCAGDNFVPGPVADRMLDIMPSKKLVFHEYRKHGTCSGLGIDGYFDFARRAYQNIQIPAKFQNITDDRLFVSLTDIKQAFIDSNPKLPADAIAVACGGPGNRLQEVRICLSREGQFRACGRNENQSKLCRADRLYVPPVRTGSGADGAQPSLGTPRLPGQPGSPLPLPGERRTDLAPGPRS